MKIFLTGSTGFIGSNLVKKLSEKHEIVCLVPSCELGMRPIPENVKIEFSDLTNFSEIKETVLNHEPEVIIHLGAATPIRYSFTFPNIYEKVNHLGTKNLVDSAIKLPNFKKFIFASTAEAYGIQDTHKPFDEFTKQNASNPYAISKINAENYIKNAGKTKGLPHIILRFTTTYGRNNEKGYVIEYAITEMLKGKSPRIGTPNSVRDFMYVDDHVNSYLKALDFNIDSNSEIVSKMKENINSFVFNIGPGRENKLIDVAEKIKKIIGFSGEILTGFPKDYPKRPTVDDYLVVNPKKANSILGWKAEYSLEEGLKKAVETWKVQL